MSPLNNLLGFEYLPEDLPRPYECGAQHYVKSRQPHDIDHKFLEDEGPLGRRTGDRLAIDEDLSRAGRTLNAQYLDSAITLFNNQT